jgi:hypothetical protein
MYSTEFSLMRDFTHWGLIKYTGIIGGGPGKVCGYFVSYTMNQRGDAADHSDAIEVDLAKMIQARAINSVFEYTDVLKPMHTDCHLKITGNTGSERYNYLCNISFHQAA